MMDMRTLHRATVQSLAEYLSKGSFTLRPFQEYIARRVTTGILKGSGRFIISVPPQHGKSELCSHWLPVWFFENFPDRHVISCSYETGNAAKWGRKVRNTIVENITKLRVRIAGDSKARGRWHTLQKGGMLCAGAGAGISGNPGHLIIIDDPHKDWADAMSETKRDAVIEWFKSAAYTRRQPGTTIIVIQTRWHERDLAGWLLAEHDDPWEEIRLPAIAEENDLMGRAPGDLLCPDLFSIEEMESTRKSLGSLQFNALYQQRPGAIDGNIFRRGWWQRYVPAARPARFRRIIHSWDTAFEKKKSAAFSACTIWAEAENGTLWLLGMWRAKEDYTTVREKMIELYTRDTPAAILLEDKATGKPLRQELRKIGLPIIPVEPCADKITRAWSVTPIFEDARVFIPTGITWADDVVDGLSSYPSGNWSDVVDTVSQALAWLSQSCSASGEDLLRTMQFLDNLNRSRRTSSSVFRFGGTKPDRAPKPIWFRPR